MNNTHIPRFLGFLLVLASFLTIGCDKTSTPPPSLTAAEIPAAFEKAFAKSKPEVKEVATQVVTALQAKDYPNAFQGVQSLGALPSLTKQQASVISSALVTVNALMQEAQAQGDAKAAQAIQHYKANK
ncbi:MAG: hypothetical protein HOP33_06400 [Verrucomicrobia bacterium]|nr:hypothetical protein [Verrucomicrobiota bacterium]